MYRQAIEHYIPHATQQIKDAYHALMTKSAIDDSGVMLGVFADRVLLRCASKKDAALAIDICTSFSNGRKVAWIVLPPQIKSINDPLAQAGYVGCVLDDSVAGFIGADEVRKIMNLCD